MYEEVIELAGKEAGPTSMVLVGVHGDERGGIDALAKILPTLKIEKGRVLFAYGNPKAMGANVRFTEANLNRMFKDDKLLSESEKKSYEYSRAQYLKKYLDQADALLDVHNSYTQKSQPFIICESNAKSIVEDLPIELVVSGFDICQPGGTDYYMNKAGKIGICVECGYFGSDESSSKAREMILAFLAVRGHITTEVQKQKQRYVRVYTMYVTKTGNFTLVKSFVDFEEIKIGSIVGIDGVEEIKADRDSVIVFARNRNQSNEEAFLLGEKSNDL